MPVKDAPVAEPPVPRVPVTDTAVAGAEGTDAINRKAFIPLSSSTAVTAVEVSEDSTKLRVIVVVICALTPAGMTGKTDRTNPAANANIPNRRIV